MEQVSPNAEVVNQVRVSSRIEARANVNVMEKDVVYASKRNLEGNNHASPISNSNSFAVLSDQEIMVRAAGMDVNIPDDGFTVVNLVREMEIARGNLDDKVVSKSMK